jgi:hypothetical protein
VNPVLTVPGNSSFVGEPRQRTGRLPHVQVHGLQPGDMVVPIQGAQGTWRSGGVFEAAAWHKVPAQLPLAAAATLCIK